MFGKRAQGGIRTRNVPFGNPTVLSRQPVPLGYERVSAPGGIRTLKPPVLSRIHIPFWYKGLYSWGKSNPHFTGLKPLPCLRMAQCYAQKTACIGKIRNRRLSDNIPYTVCILAGQGMLFALRFLPNFSIRTSPFLSSDRDSDSSYE